MIFLRYNWANINEGFCRISQGTIGLVVTLPHQLKQYKIMSNWNQFSFPGLRRFIGHFSGNFHAFFSSHFPSETQLFTLRCQKPSGVAKLTQRKCDEWILQNSYTIENCELHLKNACSFFWGGTFPPTAPFPPKFSPKKSSDVFETQEVGEIHR